MDLDTIADASLAECLQWVKKHFDVESISTRPINQDGILEYYRYSDVGYRLFHSKQGAMHVAMDCDNQFTADGFLGQVDLVADRLEFSGNHANQRVLEIGCGAGFNTKHLANRFRDCQFEGLDLSKRHIHTARRDAEGLPNLTYTTGNFQQLSYENASFKAVYAIECLCQATDAGEALAEAYRILQPGGRLIVIDCFRGQPQVEFNADLQMAARLVEKTMAVNSFELLDDWLRQAGEIGFRGVEQIDLSQSISHNLQRFYGMARGFFNRPIAARAMRMAFPQRMLENAISALLMPFTVGSGVHRYYLCMLERQ